MSATQYLDVNLTATALPATQLAFTTGPSTVAQNGAPLALQPVLQVRDANGQAVAQALVAVTVSLDAGGGTLTGGPLTVNTNASGAAVFSGLTLGGLVGTKTLKFTGTVNGIVTTLTATVGLTAGAATQLAVTTTPSTAAAVGIALVQQPVVQLRDVDGNPVAQALVSVTAAIDVGGGTLGGGTLAVSTNATGAAVFTGLAINGSVGNRTLKFTATLNGQNVSVTSGTIAVSLPVVTAVEFAGSSLVKVGQGYGYDVTQHLPGGTVVQHPVTWSILVPGTATITGTGVLGPLLPGNISIVATIDGVAWINVISSYDWVVTNTATTRAVSLTSNVAVTNFSGPPELQTLSFTCNLTTGNFGVSVGFNAIITGGGAVTYTGAGAVAIAETWLESSPLFHLLTYPGSTNTARKNFAQAIATNWAIVFTFDYTFVESQHGVHATGWQLNGIATALAPVLAACPAT